MMKYHYQTAIRTILADVFTPVGVYMRLRDIYPQSALMESSDYHAKDNSRSFIGFCPLASVSVSRGVAKLHFPDGKEILRDITSDYRTVDALTEMLLAFDVRGNSRSECGFFGYTSFNAVRYFENIEVKNEIPESNDAPDILYILFKNVIVFNHFNNSMKLIALMEDGELDQAEEQLDKLYKQIIKANVPEYSFHRKGEITSTLTDEQHRENIRKCVNHCLRGDVFQIVISRRFIQHYEGDDFKVYRALRSINPSPYLFYFDFGGFRILGSSPETHCRIEGDRAYIDPIAGTTKRTGDAEQDRKNAEFLRDDPKENAEHVMLVDLARNDLSRNCYDVKVDFLKDMQYYSHVIHLVSRVSGKLNPETNRVKTFIDTFPAGTLSGAPKVRAMQIISELEPHSRGAYGGCIGMIGFNGDLNQAIIIRTFISRNNELWFQAGSGVVAKSDSQYELEESNQKLGALVKAIERAEQI